MSLKINMGQRFQLITNTQGSIKIYHCQWLWGDYAIRRLGTAVKNFIKYNKDGYRGFEDFLKGSFYGKPEDMNSFDRYFSNPDWFDDNKEILSIYKGKKKVSVKSMDFKKFLGTLDNNDGYFYIEFGERGFRSTEKNIKGYCFIAGGCRAKEKGIEMKPITAKEYLDHYERQEGFTKKQIKEFEEGKKVFESLNLIDLPNKITAKKD